MQARRDLPGIFGDPTAPKLAHVHSQAPFIHGVREVAKYRPRMTTEGSVPFRSMKMLSGVKNRGEGFS